MRLSFLILVLFFVIGFDRTLGSSFDTSFHLDRSKQEDGSALASDNTGNVVSRLLDRLLTSRALGKETIQLTIDVSIP